MQKHTHVFSSVGGCDCQCNNCWTVRDIIMKFLWEQDMVRWVRKWLRCDALRRVGGDLTSWRSRCGTVIIYRLRRPSKNWPGRRCLWSRDVSDVPLLWCMLPWQQYGQTIDSATVGFRWRSASSNICRVDVVDWSFTPPSNFYGAVTSYPQFFDATAE